VKNKKIISTILLIALIVIIVAAVLIVKNKQVSSNKGNVELSNKEDQVIQNIRNAFDELRTDFIVQLLKIIIQMNLTKKMVMKQELLLI